MNYDIDFFLMDARISEMMMKFDLCGYEDKKAWGFWFNLQAKVKNFNEEKAIKLVNQVTDELKKVQKVEVVLIIVNSGLLWKHNDYNQFSADGTCLIVK